MKAKILPYFCFFILALGFAWYASLPGKEDENTGREWVSLPKSEIQKIVYQDDASTVTVNRDAVKQDAWWISIVDNKNQTDQKFAAADRFIANDKFNELINGLSPYRIEKLIGAADKVNLADFGLDKPTGSFEVNYGEGKTFSLTLGKRSFQSPHVFALDKQKNTVLLVERSIVGMLDKPKVRLALIKPFGFEESQIKGSKLSYEGKTLGFLRKQKGDQVQWFAESKSDVPNEAFRNWLDKILKLRIEGYPSDEQKLVLEKLEGKFKLSFIGEKGELDTVSILQEASEPPRIWFKTSNLPVPVLIDSNRFSVLLNDMTAFFQ
ncbi:MAG: DUF4340 domain-containing protein [Proteobacteria bacterium]|nr:DUF4340 domain-containing protein [Pseudomonadota bacterium]